MSTELTSNNNFWLEYDGKVVRIDNEEYKLKISTWEAIYPYRRNVLRVDARMINKKSRLYKEVREELGDDWITDILDSALELQVNIMDQLNIQKGEIK